MSWVGVGLIYLFFFWLSSVVFRLGRIWERRKAGFAAGLLKCDRWWCDRWSRDSFTSDRKVIYARCSRHHK